MPHIGPTGQIQKLLGGAPACRLEETLFLKPAN
jgi:hypothetical protein